MFRERVRRRDSSGGLELGREESKGEVGRDETGERGETRVRFPNLSGSCLCGCIDFQGKTKEKIKLPSLP